MIKFQIIYDENKKLDKMFDDLYDCSDSNINRQNKMELLVELGELTNETKCFKYWSNKKPNEENIKEEYADCLIMVFYFFNKLDISLEEYFTSLKINYDILDLLGVLYQECSEFYKNESKELIKEIFVNLINLGYKLNLSDQDIIDSCLRKINKNKERFECGF